MQPIAAVQPVVNIAMATTLPVFIKAELLEIISQVLPFPKIYHSFILNGLPIIVPRRKIIPKTVIYYSQDQ